jgi:dienelactone hydrolase
LSGDLVHVVQAARQAIADTRALVAWLRAQGCSRVGVWGLSLGAWLGGMLACVEPGLHFAVMMMPVARMDRVIAELDFCQPLRRSLRGQPARLEPMNLVTHRPRLAPDDILIVASEHDLFAPLETIEELWRAWDKPELWRLRHGHISMMMSAQVMERTVGWIAAKTAARA